MASCTASCAARPRLRACFAVHLIAAVLCSIVLGVASGCSGSAPGGGGSAGGLGSEPATPVISSVTKPAGWPSAVDIHPAARILIWRALPPREGAQTMMLSMRADAAPRAVVERYRKTLAAAGWRVESGSLTTTSVATATVMEWLSASKGAVRANVTAARQASGTGTAIVVSVTRRL